MVHFALVGKYGKPVACGAIMWSNVVITNQWKRVTCPACLEARESEDRPDKKVMAEHKQELRTQRCKLYGN